jgi:putative membrane protein
MTAMHPTGTDVSPGERTFTATDGWRRLSPKMLLVHPVKEIGRIFPALIALLVAGSNSDSVESWIWGLAAAGVVTVLAVSRWYTTRFRVSADQVQIREGLLRRRTLAARLDRVRTVDVTAHALHRTLGLARVEIGTGVSDRKGRSTLRLDGLPAAEAASLRAELLHRALSDHPPVVSPDPAVPTADPPVATADPPVLTADPAILTADPAVLTANPAVVSDHPSVRTHRQEQEVEIARLRPEWLRFAPFTLSGVFTGLAIAGFGWRIVSEGQVDVGHLGPIRSLTHQVSALPLWASVVEVVAGAVVFVAVASTIGYLLAFWDFRLTRHRGGTFHVSRGLLTTRATSIEVSRLRGVGISEPLLIRAVGGARVVAIATGLDARRDRTASRGGTVLLPDAPLDEARRVAGAVVDDIGVAAATLTGHGTTARRRRLTRALGVAAVVMVLLALLGWWLATPVAALPILLVVPLSALALATDRARNLGHLVSGGFLVAQAGSVTRRRTILETDAIIGWNIRQSFFQRRSGVATLIATTAAGRQSYRLLDLTLPKARQVADAALPGLLDEFTSAG